jgi:hypothetical protein
MTASFVALRSWLSSECADPALLAAGIGVLRPLCEQIDVDEFRLVRADRADLAALARIIAAAVGGRVGGVAALSPASMRAPLAAAIDWNALAAAMNERHAAPLNAALGPARGTSLEGAINDFEVRYEAAVWEAVWESLPDELVDRPWRDVVSGVRAVVSAFAASAAAADRARFAALAPLVRLCAIAIPLGATERAWYVLFAGTRGS